MRLMNRIACLLALGLLVATTLPASDLTVVASARYSGTYGLHVALDGSPGYVETDTPTGEKRYRVRFYLNADGVNLNVGEEVDLLHTLDAGSGFVVRVVLTRTGSGLRVFLETAEDTGSASTGNYVLPAGWRAIELDWQAASSAGANDGALDVWIDGAQQSGLSNLDSDTLTTETARLGCIDSVGTVGGTLRLDDFVSVRADYIGLASAFSDVLPSDWYAGFVHALYALGLTSGFPDGTFKPLNLLSRAEIAVFLLRGLNGASYAPPAATGTVFTDVNGSEWYAAWVEALRATGLVSGYPDGSYRALNNVTRAELAVMLLRAKHGTAYTPPAASGAVFTDVNGSEWFAAWVERLAAEGIVSGFPDGTFRALNNATRAEVAVMIQRTFGLPLPTF